MFPRFLTVAKYEVKQYQNKYFEQLFIFASILLIFLLVSGSDPAVADAPSAFGLYNVGYVRGSLFTNVSHYSLTMIPYVSKDAALSAVAAGNIDVFADETDGFASFTTSGTLKSAAALKRLKQVLLGSKRDQIYAIANANSTMDGILLPIKVKVQDFQIDYGKATDPQIYAHRIRFINNGYAEDNATLLSRINILNLDAVRGMNLTQYLLSQPTDTSGNESDVGFTLPEEWEIPFVFKSLYNNMAVVSVSILMSMLLTLSLGRDKVNKTLINLLQTPLSRLDIIAGKSLPYILMMFAINLGYSLSVATGWDVLKVFYILSVLSVTLASFALFTVLASKNYREITFMSSISLMSFLMFIVLPNVFSGVNVLAFVSPLDTITSIQNRAYVSPADVFLSLLPYKFLCLFFVAFTLSCFDNETFHNTPSIRELVRIFYTTMNRRLGGGLTYVIATVSILVPFVYITQTVIAYIILPFGYIAPYASIFLLAMVEETTKILPFVYNRRIKPLTYGLIAGAHFFATEKIFNIYLISKVYSYLPAPYTVIVNKGLFDTLLLHVVATTLFAAIISRHKSKKTFIFALIAATAVHYIYNVTMLGGLSAILGGLLR